MSIEVKLRPWAEDDALARIVAALRNPRRWDPATRPLKVQRKVQVLRGFPAGEAITGGAPGTA